MERQTGFRPLNDDHAIESVKFSVAFSKGIVSRSIFAVEQNHHEWRDGLPARSIADFTIESNGRTADAPGVVFAFVRPDASPSWSMTVAGNRIDVECFLYSRWDRVWKDACEYFVKVFKVLSETQTDLSIGAVDLTVKDVFVTDDQSYLLGHLLNRSPRLPDFIFTTPQAWHANSGWFEEDANWGKILNNLNCDVSPAQGRTFFNFSHFQQIVLKRHQSIKSEESARGFLDEAMNFLHLSNKRLISELLKDDMADRIGLRSA